MNSRVIGADLLKRRLGTFRKEMGVQAGDLIVEQAGIVQRDLVDIVPMRSGQAAAALASPDAIKTKTDSRGIVSQAKVGLNTTEQGRKAFYLLFLEKGRKRYVAGDAKLGVRFAGLDRRYAKARMTDPNRDARKWRRVKRNVGPIEARQYFRVVYTMLRERMATARGLNRLKAFAIDNFKHIGR